MPRPLTVLATVLIVSCGVATSAPAAWHGTVIAVSDYRSDAITDLMYAERDARLMRDALAGLDVRDTSTVMGRDAGRAAIRHAINAQSSNAAPGDSLLVHFSGHGGSVTGSDGEQIPVIWPWDAEPNDPQSAIPVAELLSWAAGPHDTLVILDCGFGTASDPSFYAPNRIKSLGGAPISRPVGAPPQNVTLLLAGYGRSPALESSTLRHGVLTHYVARALTGTADADGDGLIRLPELVPHAGARMHEAGYLQGMSLLGLSPVRLAFPTSPRGARSSHAGRALLAGRRS